jgi:magnesium transporter
MINEYLAYPPGITVGEAMERFRKDATELEAYYYIYVVEGEKLLGVLGLRDLLLEDPGKPISDVMHKKLITVHADAGQETVAELISKYNLLALPVVDEEHCLLGVVTVDDVVDLLLPPASRRKRRKM